MADLVAEIHSKQNELKRYGRLSLVSILEAIGERRDEENPLFDVAFNFIDFHVYESVKGLFEFMPFSFERTNMKLDFSVSVTLGQPSIKVVSSYGREWSELLVEKFIHTLRFIVERPDERISPMSWMTEAERQQLAAFNDTDAEYPRNESVIDRFEQAAQLWADRPALVMDDRELDYVTLRERVNMAAARLKQAKVGPGQFVGLLADRSFEMIIGLLAIMKTGAAYVPLDPEFPNERLLAILSDCKANVLVAGEGLKVSGFDGVTLSLTELCDPDGEQPQTIADGTHPKAEDIAYVMYTSGSTGEPKGVAVTHRNIVKTVINNGFMDVLPTDRMLQLSNYAFDGSTYEIFGALLNGAALVLIRKSDVLNAAELAKVFDEQRITSAFMTTSLFNMMVDWGLDRFRHVRRLFFGGEAGSLKHVRKALEVLGPGRIANGYGPTETTVFATTYVVDENIHRVDSVPIGRPINNTRVYILNQQGELQPPGVPGELHIAGDGLARGYLGRDDLTNERYVPCPFEKGQRMYKTGDLARWLPDGHLEYMGRIDQQVKIRGNRVETGRNRKRLLALSSVKEAAVVPFKDKRGQTMLCAYVVPAGPASIAGWKRSLREQLPEYMVPAVFMVMDRLPLTSNGKVNRRALPAPAVVQQEAAYEPAANETEAMLISLWEDILDLPRIGANDHFLKSAAIH